MELSAAVEDLKKHTLVSLRGEIARLIYLAGTRDYNTGKYHHDGLALRFTQEIANEAIGKCHEEVFRRVAETPLEDLVSQLQEYITGEYREDEVIAAWLKLEPYRVVIPLTCDPLSAKLFCSNLMIALAILESRAKNRAKN